MKFATPPHENLLATETSAPLETSGGCDYTHGVRKFSILNLNHQKKKKNKNKNKKDKKKFFKIVTFSNNFNLKRVKTDE